MKVAETSIGRGVVASRQLRKGEVLLRVPLDTCIYGTSCKDVTFQLTPEYVNNLPDESNFPIFWEKVNPRFTPFVDARIKQLKDECIDYENYAILRSFVGSRNFNKGGLTVLVKEAEMLNHSLSPNTKWYWEGDDFVLETTERVRKEEQLYDSYGKKDGYYEMLYYGFVSNPMTMIRGQKVTLQEQPFEDLDQFHEDLKALKEEIEENPDPLSPSEMKVCKYWLKRCKRAKSARKKGKKYSKYLKSK